MLRIFFLCVLPAVIALFLCCLVGNAIPALAIGGFCLIPLVLGLMAMGSDKGGDGMGLMAAFVLIVLPSAINVLLLLGGSGVYYLARYLGG